ncbi:MAG: protein-glutamate O-methyltransferase [Nitrococcus sp.]|nr:protein-glutamate O-methyltransferase [Nitrococcus sp.]
MPASAPAYSADSISEADFRYIRAIIAEQAGIQLSEQKRSMVHSRLAKRVRSLGLPSIAAYCDQVRNYPERELTGLISALTTNVTAFFREPHHFAFLAERIMPELLERNAASRRLRIWSAGCSSGEEPYSIAMTVIEAMPASQSWDFKLLATDLDQEVLAFGREGVYRGDRLDGIAPEQRRRWFRRAAARSVDRALVVETLREHVSFLPLNLMGQWPMKGPFDVIFCRNVIIYFDQPRKARLIRRFSDLLTEGGHLIIGHSESLHGLTDRFRPIGKTIYRRGAAEC